MNKQKFAVRFFSPQSRVLATLAACAIVGWMQPLGTAQAANTYAENGDAGDLPASAQIVSGPANTSLDYITGTISLTNGISEGDMFEIFINSPTTFSASTTAFIPGSNNFDTQLFLFNAVGKGIVADDDDPTSGSPQSTLTAGSGFVLTPGLYFLLVDGSGRYPVSPSGLIFPNYTDNTTDPTANVGPTGPGGALPVSGYTGNSNAGGNYSIALTGAQFVVVPEPSTFVAVASGLALLVIARRRR